MTETAVGLLPIEVEADIVLIRRAVREASARVGFGLTDVTRIVTAASELARNVHRHATRGDMRWSILEDPTHGRFGIELTFSDTGPGIADVQQAFQEGWSTCGGLGMGLPGTRRLMDEMEVQSEPGRGTVVRVRKWGRR